MSDEVKKPSLLKRALWACATPVLGAAFIMGMLLNSPGALVRYCYRKGAALWTKFTDTSIGSKVDDAYTWIYNKVNATKVSKVISGSTWVLTNVALATVVGPWAFLTWVLGYLAFAGDNPAHSFWRLMLLDAKMLVGLGLYILYAALLGGILGGLGTTLLFAGVGLLMYYLISWVADEFEFEAWSHSDEPSPFEPRLIKSENLS